VTLTPPQASAALSYFIYPYVEVDGSSFAQATIKFSFCDVNASGAATTSGGK
jgi:hypothetical protein